ncbi:MAG: putative peptide zinc metalloprotease protein [Chthoniobacter sp.]|jgi:putative peptide zinc metalloprotease protein|nr:putative peptide zinc metalloprotease protein [Chthoniobacter sp.]
MSAETKTFSESWYRIAHQRVALRPHVRVRRQYFRGERYYVLQDPFNNQFFRLRPAAYEFVARLRLERPVESVWQECLEASPEEAPGQEDALRLLAQLYGSNLLHSNLSPDSAKLFERYATRRQRETRSKLLNAMYSRFPLFDPDALLKAALPVLRRVLSPAGAGVWLVVVGWAIKVVVEHAGTLRDQSQAILAPGNLILLYCGTVLIKAIHEFGHAAACRRFGGEVHVMGVMLMLFTPMPYVDTTSSWAFRSRWERAFVGAAGMVAELFFAALAAFLWAATAPGTIHSLAYNIMAVASVSTLLFNINPLLRFDGYYILSDLLEIPNLQARATQQLTHLAERWLFGCKTSRSPALTRREAIWLSIFGVTSRVYQVFLFGAILLFMADRFLILGMLMAVVCAVSWVVLPAFKFAKYLAASPRLARHRPRALAVSGVGALALVVLLELIPAPNHFRAPGVVEAVEHSIVSAEVGGRLEEILIASGGAVARGQTMLRMEDPELELEIGGARAELEGARAGRQRAMEEAIADLQAIDSRIEAVEKHLHRLEQRRAALTVRAPHDGLWIAPNLDHYRHGWLPRGVELGQIVNPKTFRFSAVVSEDDASRLFAGEIRSAQVRLFGQAAQPLRADEQKIIPAEQQTLPSAALGWRAGGEVALASADREGMRTRDPFFALHARIDPAPPVLLLHGRSGTIRFDLQPEPLLEQWMRKLRQLVQKRYGI